MAKLKLRVRLTAEKFASLKEVGTRPMQRTIPDAHRDRLVAVGYVRAVAPFSGGVSALALTEPGTGSWQVKTGTNPEKPS